MRWSGAIRLNTSIGSSVIVVRWSRRQRAHWQDDSGADSDSDGENLKAAAGLGADSEHTRLERLMRDLSPTRMMAQAATDAISDLDSDDRDDYILNFEEDSHHFANLNQSPNLKTASLSVSVGRGLATRDWRPEQ
jgi:hypothetical protein